MAKFKIRYYLSDGTFTTDQSRKGEAVKYQILRNNIPIEPIYNSEEEAMAEMDRREADERARKKTPEIKHPKQNGYEWGR